jgi:hypothetical protein
MLSWSCNDYDTNYTSALLLYNMIDTTILAYHNIGHKAQISYGSIP